jgi:anti-sigma regulatory factor (Ser/Thr protein kinase)
MLIMVSVILLVQESQLLFDGIGEAFTPIISVYLSEKCFVGVRKIWHFASITCVLESFGTMLLLILLSGKIPALLGITDPELLSMASMGIIIMTPGMVFTCYLYTLTSYYRLLDEVILGVVISVFRDSLCIIPIAVAGGMLFGIEGVFGGIAAGAVLAFILSRLYVGMKYGKKNQPLLLDSREKGLKSYLFELEVNPEEVIQVRDSMEHALQEAGAAGKQILRMMLMLEELLMLIYERNGHDKVLAECAMTVSTEKITMIIHDNGVHLDFTDPDRKISSLRSYIVPGLLSEWCREGYHLTALSFNRNSFEINNTV